MATTAPGGSGEPRSVSEPLITVATAAFANREPILLAKSRPVAPCGKVRIEPSGKETSIVAEDALICTEV